METLITMRFFFFIFLFYVFLCSFAFSFEKLTEEELKVAFVYNFLKFVSWPEKDNSKEKKSSTLNLCIVGKTPLESYLFSLDGKVIKNRIIRVRTADIDDLSECQAVFVGDLSNKDITFVLSSAVKSGVLTISDLPDFIYKGGIIEIFMVGNKLRFSINLVVSQKSGLKISSRLLKLARMVIRDDGKFKK